MNDNEINRDGKGCYMIEVNGTSYPFDLSMATIYQFAEKAGWRKDALQAILDRLIRMENMGDMIDLYDLALLRGFHSSKSDATKIGKPDKGDLMGIYLILYKNFIHSIEAFYTANGIDMGEVKAKLGEEKKDIPSTIS